MKKLVVALVLAGLLMVGALLAGLAYLGAVTPETHVVTGREMSPRYVDTIRELGLLEEDEEIVYFYSDALLDIRESFCFVTEDRLVVYSEVWEEPAIVMPFDEVARLEVEFEPDWWIDSSFVAEARDGTRIEFPVSSERGGDRRVCTFIDERMAGPADAQEPAEAEPAGEAR